MYLRIDEAAGNVAYDLSKEGINFNNNNNAFFVQDTEDGRSNEIPDPDQLGFFGVSDDNGNYIISAIPYNGNGETFAITPTFGVHTFEPGSKTVFLGEESAVVNQLDFKDISSFKFLGRVIYNTQGVFQPVDLTSNEVENYLNVNSNGDATDHKQIEDFGYNQYLIGQTYKVYKGEFYYEGGTKGSDGFYTGGKLVKYTDVPVEEVQIFIDDQVFLDEDNQPVLTNENGEFEIQVPIGQHKITVAKHNHELVYEGDFPNPEQRTFDFFKDAEEVEYFIDNTRISVVGRVVGGQLESDKEIGFGYNGVKVHEYETSDGRNKE